MIKKVDREGTLFIANHEGFRATAYDDLQPYLLLLPTTKIKGTLTIGYGTTRYEDGSKVKIGDTISKEKALQLLEKQIDQHCADFVKKVTYPLNQNQFNALASFSYNCGKSAISNNKKMLESLNKGDFVDAMNRLRNYKYSKGIVLQGLVKRRNQEIELFNKAVPKTTVKEPVKEPVKVVATVKPKAEQYTVVTNINGYKTAQDAKNRKNKASTVKVGTYYVYTKNSTMLNVSTKENAPGSWINPSDNVKATTKAVTHKVVKGDTVSAIAKKYGTTIAKIKELNKLDSKYTIKVGQVLTIKK